MPRIRCISPAISPTDLTIALMDGRPIVARLTLRKGLARVRVYDVRPSEAVFNACDGVRWFLESGEWAAQLRTVETNALPSPLTRAPIRTLCPRADWVIIEALGLAPDLARLGGMAGA